MDANGGGMVSQAAAEALIESLHAAYLAEFFKLIGRLGAITTRARLRAELEAIPARAHQRVRQGLVEVIAAGGKAADEEETAP